ncbi:enterobactin transporter EntS [Nonomuraea jiangxiensis]|uniref:MFS transporter, ENTS family, enterobactin (Siderophore) exporter n=1 Tax=Nonomuraea jiangxiensis TaxID=633440 RepID=A0A1G8DIX5_9ACTN|nr:enterobactin transporter EntS [Nonomuraea jiangxiensis]SDH57614.1 MFS transporter, ENTS family, enterobactin (siderophore) exporter [Nonomuraea jiangxiensis]
MRLGQFVVDVAPLRASRDFRFAFAARLVSLLGVGVTGVALAVQVFDLTGSSLHVALVSLALGGPLLAGTLAGGVLADRLDRRRLVVWSRVIAAAGFAGLGLNALLPEPELWALYGCAALIGLADGLSETALMAVTPALVGRERLAAAEALTSITTQLGTVAGPSLGGLLIAGPGLAACFWLTTLTTAVTIVLLCRMRPLPPAGEAADRHPLRALADGARYALRNRLISGLILLDLSGTLFAMPYAVFPELVAGRFEGNAAVLGLLYSAPATGALLTALTSGWVAGVRRPGRWLIGSVALWGLAMVGFGLSGELWKGLLFLAVSGAGQVVSEVLAGALLQGNTPDELLGRVSSLWLAEATVGPAVGNLIAGGLARVSSPAGAVVAGGLACVAAVALLALAVPELRRARPLTTGDPVP